MGVLGALRAVFDHDGGLAADYESGNTQSAAARMSRSLKEGNELDFDVALSTIPLGSHGNRATYWIHPDHFVEAQVLLLQHLRIYKGSTSTSLRNQSTRPTPQRRQSSMANSDRYFGQEDEVGMLILDHAEAFAIKQNASTIGSTEATKGNNIFKAAGNVHCVSSGDAAIVVCDDAKGAQQTTSNIKSARLRMRYLSGMLDTDAQSLQQNAGGAKDVVAVRRWLTDHKEVSPIAGIGARRTRFVGLHNNFTGGVWATLDKDVYMKSSMSKDFIHDEWPSAARSNAINFPHAILEVRREGAQATALIQTLDRSHLAC